MLSCLLRQSCYRESQIFIENTTEQAAWGSARHVPYEDFFRSTCWGVVTCNGELLKNLWKKVVFKTSYKTTKQMHQRSKIYFVIKLYRFWTSSVPIIRSYLLYTRQLVSFMQIMWPLPNRVRLEHEFQPDSVRKRSQNVHETYQLPSVQ